MHTHYILYCNLLDICKDLSSNYHYNDKMNVETINPYVIKIIIAARAKDSIRAISRRIGLSYAWTYKWVHALADEGVFKIQKRLTVNKKNNFYKSTIAYINEVLAKEVSFFYKVL